ncbi:hypothetical protein ACP70R_015727 [Stipagrostis hirtigluma subsp. patula]
MQEVSIKMVSFLTGTFGRSGMGRYRDTVRQFIKGTDGFAGAFAECLCGSPQLYQELARSLREAMCNLSLLPDETQFNLDNRDWLLLLLSKCSSEEASHV